METRQPVVSGVSSTAVGSPLHDTAMPASVHNSERSMLRGRGRELVVSAMKRCMWQ